MSKLEGLRFHKSEGELQTCRRLQVLRNSFNPLPYAIPYDQQKEASFLKVAGHIVDKRCFVEVRDSPSVADMGCKIKVLFLTGPGRFSLKIGKSPFLERPRIVQDLGDDLSAGFRTPPQLAFHERGHSQGIYE